RLAEDGPTLGVADDDVVAERFELARADLAGRRYVVLPVHVLRAEPDIAHRDHRLHRCQIDKRWAEHDVEALDIAEPLADAVCEMKSCVQPHVALPVSGDERCPSHSLAR